jgi:hypothetical protein
MGSRLVIVTTSMNHLPPPIENSSIGWITWRKRHIVQTTIAFVGEHNVILCQNNLVCHKHETLSRCLRTTSPQANWKHPRHRLLWTHMEDIWHWCHCDPKLWTHFPYPLHSQFWHIMSMVCPCTISLLIIEKYPHHIGILLGLGNIWHLLPHRPKLQWCVCPIGQPICLFILQLDYLTYFVLWRKLESQK